MVFVRRAAVALALFAALGVMLAMACSSETPHPPAAPEDAGPPGEDVYYPPPVDANNVFVDAAGDGAVDGATDGAIHEGGQDACTGGTDVGCGGLSCPPCGAGLKCNTASDCESLVCGTKNQCALPPCTCQAPTCGDGVKNQGETDVDCGGPCPKCGPGKSCGVAADCASSVCTTGKCACPAGMIPLPTNLPTGGNYCIDVLEVTLNDYHNFWVSNPSLANQPSYCSWNDNYTPTGDWPPTLTQVGYQGGNPSFQKHDGVVLDRNLTLEAAKVHNREHLELVDAGGGV